MSAYHTGQLFLATSKTAKQLNVTFVAEANRWAFEHRTSIRAQRDGLRVPSALGGHNTVLLVPMAEGEQAVERVRGMTLQGALVDEATSMHPQLALMLDTRLSQPGARAWWTCNPEGPLHWFLNDWIRNPNLNSIHIPFELDDNPSLTDDYKNALKASVTGHMYDRWVRGKWVTASGLVWPEAAQQVGEPPKRDPTVTVIAVDYAASSITHALLLALHGKVWYVTREWRLDSTREPVTSTRQADALIRWAAEHGHEPRRGLWIVDPAAADMNAALRERGCKNVEAGFNDRINGVRAVGHAFASGSLKVSLSGCPQLLRELGNYSWNETAAAKGTDDPQRVDDHGCDALRYGIATTNVMRMRGSFSYGPRMSDVMEHVFSAAAHEPVSTRVLRPVR